MGDTNNRAVAIAHFLADHDGVISAAQAQALGMSRDQIYQKRASGLWAPTGKSVYLSAEHHMTEKAMVRTAALAHRGVIDRDSAVWLHGLIDELPEPVTLSVPRSAHGVTCAVSTSVRRRTFPAEDLAVVDGIDVTALPLTVLIGAGIRPDDGMDIMDEALFRKRVSLPELRETADRNAGMHGMARARELLESAEDIRGSYLERLFVRFLNARGITGWIREFWIGGRRIDFVFPEERIAVELHGWRFHHMLDRWERDQQTTNMLAGLGWLPLIFTLKRLKFSPNEVEKELMAAFEQRRWAA